MKESKNKKTQSDVLYWASSNKSKDKDYHITRTLEAVLRKLIHYSRKNEKITYSNSKISEHTYICEETIRKAIPILAKKGYLSTATFKIFDNGEVKTRRTIYIKWDFIASVYLEVPKEEEQISNEDLLIKPEINNEEPLVDEPIREPLVAKIETQPVSWFETTTEAVPPIVITDEKLQWVKNATKNHDLTKENLEFRGLKFLDKLFYNEIGVWKIKDEDFDKRYENRYLIKYTFTGGSKCELCNKNNSNDRINVRVDELNYYYEQTGVSFSELSQTVYKIIKQNGLPKIPK